MIANHPRLVAAYQLSWSGRDDETQILLLRDRRADPRFACFCAEIAAGAGRLAFERFKPLSKAEIYPFVLAGRRGYACKPPYDLGARPALRAALARLDPPIDDWTALWSRIAADLAHRLDPDLPDVRVTLSSWCDFEVHSVHGPPRDPEPYPGFAGLPASAA